MRGLEWLAGTCAAALIVAVVMLFTFDRGALGDAEHAAKVIAILAGGLWVLYQFALRRAFESTVLLTIDVRIVPSATDYRAFVEVGLTNTGNRRIYAAPKLSAEQCADYEDSVLYPCDLELRNMDAPRVVNYDYESWWPMPMGLQKDRHGNPHVPVLAEYSLADGSVDFFMEPGEKYFLGHLFRLKSGYYMVKVVFVGTRAGAAEYWSRTSCFGVPDDRRVGHKSLSQEG